MTMTISTREKKMLIVVAFIAVLFFAVQFAILPLFQTYQSKKADFDQLKQQKMEIELKLASEDAIQQSYAKAQELYQTQQESYPLQLPSEGIDKILTTLSVQNQLLPTSLTFSETKQVMLEPPKEEENDTSIAQTHQDQLDEAQKLQDEATGQEVNTEETAPQEEKPSVFWATQASMDLVGDYSSVKSLVNAANRMPNVRVLQINMRPNMEMGSVTAGPQLVTILFEFTMLETTPS